MNRRYWEIAGTAVVLASLLAGCSGGKPDAAEQNVKPAEPSPVTIRIGIRASSMMDADDFKRYVQEPVKKKYPHITVEQIDIGVQGQSYADLVAAKQIPDIVAAYPLSQLEFHSLGISYNIESLIKQHGFDLNRIQPEILESVKVGAGTDYLIGLPIFNNSYALVYNKTMFDRFGVPYPKDGMTWDDAKNLAMKLTRGENGVQYYGLNPGDGVFRGAYQLSLPFIDTKNDKAVFQTQQWKDLFDMWNGLYKAQGIPKGANLTKAFDEGTVGMAAYYTTQLLNLLKLSGFDWDVVTYPVNPKAPGVGQRVDSLVLSITSASPNKDAAFDVLSVILSDEVQTDMSRNIRASVLKDRAVQDQFGQANEELKKKNVAAYTKLKLAVVQSFKYSFTPNPAAAIQAKFNQVAFDGKDVNTALREADEEMTKAIEAQKNR